MATIKGSRTQKKKGWPIGTFCRIYDVPGAMEAFLPGIYEPCGEDRYTYTGGSTTGGAVLYDNGDFLFSHHATDPAGDRLCNSFDLVRIHKFGHMDEQAIPGTPSHKLPSNKEMLRFAANLEDVKLEQARNAFLKDAPQENDEWLKGLDWGSNGLLKNAKNIMLVLENDPRLAGKRIYRTHSILQYTRTLRLGVGRHAEDRQRADRLSGGGRYAIYPESGPKAVLCGRCPDIPSWDQIRLSGGADRPAGCGQEHFCEAHGGGLVLRQPQGGGHEG